MHIAIVCPYPPYAGIPTAGGSFLDVYISHLSNKHEVDLMCTTEPEPRTLATYNGSVRVYFSPPLMTGGTSRLRQQARTLTGFNIGTPEVDGLKADPRAREVLKAADIVDFQWSELLRALPSVRRDRQGKPIVATEHDVYSTAMVRLARSRSDTVDRIAVAATCFRPRGHLYGSSLPWPVRPCSVVQPAGYRRVAARRAAPALCRPRPTNRPVSSASRCPSTRERSYSQAPLHVALM